MKIYVKQLVALAVSKAPPDRAGWLLKRGEVNKNFQKRWFVLRGNLLFYFERPEREPVGLIVLEGCSIELAECSETERYAFLIIFHGQGVRTYTLAADSQEDMEGWMKALSCANYDFLRNTVAELQRQIDEIRSSSTQPEQSGAVTSSHSPLGPALEKSLSKSITVSSAPTVLDIKPSAPLRKKNSASKQSQPPAVIEFNPFNYESATATQQATRTPVTFSELHARYANQIQQVLSCRLIQL
ncbi:sesquipedalian-1-like [Varroa jacobsoni]|uniref:PH domain-containing protein n=1 Tax=Varroa destructor TaxID=109461 RepID=A0A7M7KQW1_VARDE|nr:sesquipedalian-1-like isoform X2 [Varroa destructor]XP_022711301.1 sesquipedalian-1-like [Varroa jacobsoni]XP_022711310.1 sesquipedalian-1-like [Varroa jacobsoni]XP_022711318.1 sesquipedalian-1-like [Varroa jacobsoni]XP_022711326.1 sesquipedalian-1-like [Varroa jacobsoni]XP_022711333.1 sesquipedalian-1-like [Varroa jacobsoni]XP_022711340.1 sesquipedalian-1-like [Varroa jacobsoni]XP_022711348.1 sesquipedalian-1-like [Varroa jacobsoni]XP_022711358.1 sesquipedalian-1-like [Varroa jacobsoni]